MMRTSRRPWAIPAATSRLVAAAPLVLVLLVASAGQALAGGGPENVSLIVDPANAESMYIANYYRSVRDIPDANIVYMAPGADTYADLASFQVDALLGTLATRGLAHSVDYVVVPPGGSFYVPMEGLVDGSQCCSVPVKRMAMSSAYTLAMVRDEIMAGGEACSEPNRFFGPNDKPQAFDADTGWLGGVPNTTANARRYFVGFMLGYTGERGNTVAEVKTMIDRSASADGTRPDGTFYYMRTSDADRSGQRHAFFPPAVASLVALGARAEELFQVDGQDLLVPVGRHDVLGVMTGHSAPPIDKADMTLLPGTFADHITSYAATFDGGDQTKMSRWIARGASGTMGTVEEPCVVHAPGYTGKFPHPRLFVYYYQGMSLGESLLRSIQWTPYQSLFMGDPLTRPFAWLPTVAVPDAPPEIVSGVVEITPLANSDRADTAVAEVELLIDGRRLTSGPPGQSMRFDTSVLADGPHDIRVIGYDDSPVRNQGRWVGTLSTSNAGLSVDLAVTPTQSDLGTLFTVDVSAPIPVREIRLRHGRRVLAATRDAAGRFTVPARVLGAGPVRLVAEAEFPDGRLAVSAPVTLDIPYAVPLPTPGAPAPVAFDVMIDVLPDQPTVLDLPVLDAGGDIAGLVISGEPEQATATAGAGTVLLRPNAGATGTDTLTFSAVVGDVESAPATATIRYCEAPWIVSKPAAVKVCPGRSADLRVIAGGERLSYQWYKDGAPIAGAVAAQFSIVAATAEDVGSYHVEFTGRCGDLMRTVPSPPAALELNTAPGGCGATVYVPFASR